MTGKEKCEGEDGGRFTFMALGRPRARTDRDAVDGCDVLG